MNKRISFFNDDFYKEIDAIKKEEDKVRELEKLYKEAKSKLKDNNLMRLKKLREMRKSKLFDINSELIIVDGQIKKLENEYLENDKSKLDVISKKIVDLKIYKKYLLYLKTLMCVLFGHEAVLIDNTEKTYLCNCCGQTMSYNAYINSHVNAKYKGVIESFNQDNNYIINSINDSMFTLPTYNNYLDLLKNKKVR